MSSQDQQQRANSLAHLSEPELNTVDDEVDDDQCQAGPFDDEVDDQRGKAGPSVLSNGLVQFVKIAPRL